MSFMESFTGVAELRALIAKQQRRIDDLELAVHGLRRPLVAAQVLGNAIVQETEKNTEAPMTAARAFYEDVGGYMWFKSNVTIGKRNVCKLRERMIGNKMYSQIVFGIWGSGRGRSKSKCFPTRREAEQFAFDVLQIHDRECTRRNKPTDWWNRVTIFEQLSVTNRGHK